MATHWGIAGAGKIAHDYVTCLRSLKSTEHKIVAVASQVSNNSKAFAATHSISKFYNSYAELANDVTVEIVYVANLNPFHFATAKMMLEAGKHVLCEKPMCTNLRDTEELIKIAKQKKRFLMEGIWSRFFPIYDHLRKLLAKKVLDDPKFVQVLFAFSIENLTNNSQDRITKPHLGGSITLDVGIYALQLVSLVYKGVIPKQITALGQLNSEGADETVQVIMDYGNVKSANIVFSCCFAGYNSAVISGNRKFIRLLPSFHSPTTIETPTETLEYSFPKTIIDNFNYETSPGLIYEAEAVRRHLKDGLFESPLITLEESRLLAYMMEEIRKQLGAKFFEP